MKRKNIKPLIFTGSIIASTAIGIVVFQALWPVKPYKRMLIDEDIKLFYNSDYISRRILYNNVFRRKEKDVVKLEGHNILEIVKLAGMENKVWHKLVTNPKKPLETFKLDINKKTSWEEIEKEIAKINTNFFSKIKQEKVKKSDKKQYAFNVVKDKIGKKVYVSLYVLKQSEEFVDWVDEFTRDLGKIDKDNIEVNNPNNFLTFMTGEFFIDNDPKYLFKALRLKGKDTNSNPREKEQIYKEAHKTFFTKWNYFSYFGGFSFKRNFLESDKQPSEKVQLTDGNNLLPFNKWRFTKKDREKHGDKIHLSQSDQQSIRDKQKIWVENKSKDFHIYVSRKAMIDFLDDYKIKFTFTFYKAQLDNSKMVDVGSLPKQVKFNKPVEIAKRVLVHDLPFTDLDRKFSDRFVPKFKKGYIVKSESDALELMKEAFIGINKKGKKEKDKKGLYQLFFENNRLFQTGFALIQETIPSVAFNFDYMIKVLKFLDVNKKSHKIFTDTFLKNILQKLEENKHINVDNAFEVVFLNFVNDVKEYMKDKNKHTFFWTSLNKLKEAQHFNGGQWELFHMISSWTVIVEEILSELIDKKIIENLDDVLGQSINSGSFISKLRWSGIQVIKEKDIVELLEVIEEQNRDSRINNKESNKSNIWAKIGPAISKMNKKEMAKTLYKFITQSFVSLDKKDWKQIASLLVHWQPITFKASSKDVNLFKESPEDVGLFLWRAFLKGWDSPIAFIEGLGKATKINLGSIIQILKGLDWSWEQSQKESNFKLLKTFVPLFKNLSHEQWKIVINTLNHGLKKSLFENKEKTQKFIEELVQFLKNDSNLGEAFANFVKKWNSNKLNESTKEDNANFANSMFTIFNRPLIKNSKLNWTKKVIENWFKIFDTSDNSVAKEIAESVNKLFKGEASSLETEIKSLETNINRIF